MAGLVIEARPSSAEGVRNGVFRIGPRRIEGLIGERRVVFERNAGGVFSAMGEGVSPLARVAARMELVGPQGQELTIRQEADSNPHFYYLEEGPQRIGLRVIYTLYDQNDTYHGEGLQEVWLYPNGDLFCSVGMRLTDNLAHVAITDAWLEATLSPSYAQMIVGTLPGTDGTALGAGAKKEFEFDESSPGRFVAGEGEGSALALYWLKSGGRQKVFAFGRPVSAAPFYYRWSALFDQFFSGGPGRGWKVNDTSRLEVDRDANQPVVRLCWMKDAQVETKDWVCLGGIFAMSQAPSLEDLRPRIAAHRNPLDLSVEGGEFGGYDDLEGCYMVRKIGNPVQVTLPKDSLSRRATVKVFSLSGKGAVVVKVDGKEMLADLVSDGGIVDDPLAPVQVQPHAPAKECVLSVGLSPDREHVLTVEERPGIQMVYQAAYSTLEQRRNWVVYSDKCAERGSLEFSALDGKARNISAWGRNQEAVTELTLFWFQFCGYSPHDYLDQTRDVEIIKNGPDEVEFYYRGTNFSDRAQSEFWVTIPSQADCLRMQMKCRFTVLQTWRYFGNQFYDVFPHEGVYPDRWWYEKVMFLDKDGRLGIHYNPDRAKSVNLFDKFEDKSFFAMYPTDRGNLLTLVRDVRPAGHVVHVAVCGNYIDHHLNLDLGQPPIPAGSVFEVDYDLALYGDRTTSEEELAEIGRKSLEAGHFVLP